MGKLIVTEFMTLDGVAQAPGGREEDREAGFDHGGWQAPVGDAESAAAMFEQARTMDALLLGRKTYDIFASYWPTADPKSPFTDCLIGCRSTSRVAPRQHRLCGTVVNFSVATLVRALPT